MTNSMRRTFRLAPDIDSVLVNLADDLHNGNMSALLKELTCVLTSVGGLSFLDCIDDDTNKMYKVLQLNSVVLLYCRQDGGKFLCHRRYTIDEFRKTHYVLGGVLYNNNITPVSNEAIYLEVIQ